MRREWSFHRSSRRRGKLFFLILAGILLFVLGFFAARPILTLLGLVS